MLADRPSAFLYPQTANDIYFVFLPKGEYLSAMGVLSFQPGGFCAYHSSITTGPGTGALYAAMPYAGTDLAHCFAGPAQPPNYVAAGNSADADAEISIVSHEHFETVTDPKGTAWWNSASGNEIGDNCSYVYGSSGLTPVDPDGGNISLNGHRYVVQMEWSNNDASGSNGCVRGYPDHLAVVGPGSPPPRGGAFSIAVNAEDHNNQRDTAYRGTVHFTSTDLSVVLPDYTFTASDNGVHIFNGVVLVAAGSQDITATDTVAADPLDSTTTVSGTVSIGDPGAPVASSLSVAAGPGAVSGVGVTFTVTALTASLATDTAYRGTVHFKATDGAASLPADYTFTAFDNGFHSFNVTLLTLGAQTVTATDSASSSVKGSTNITVAGATKLVVTAPASANPNSPINVTVTARTDGLRSKSFRAIAGLVRILARGERDPATALHLRRRRCGHSHVLPHLRLTRYVGRNRERPVQLVCDRDRDGHGEQHHAVRHAVIDERGLRRCLDRHRDRHVWRRSLHAVRRYGPFHLHRPERCSSERLPLRAGRSRKQGLCRHALRCPARSQ